MDNITKEKLEIVAELNKIAGERGQSLAKMALAWNLQTNTSVILGASKVAQIRENVQALDNTEFSDEELKKINNILSYKKEETKG